MGCIYSKAIARSMSMREEVSHGFHRSSSVAWEELLTSHGGTDHLFALVYSAANATVTKPRTSNVSLDIQETEPETQAGEDDDSSVFRRSKSCELMTESKLDWGDKSPAGSRSFHTVEEYDALMERIRKFSTRSVQHFEDCDDYSSGSDDVKVVKEINDLDVNPDGGCVQETGWKRKAVGKGIKPLDVSTIEFPDIGKWRQQRLLVEGGEQIFSPGTYVTPKFGSYNEKVICRSQEKDGGDNSVFSRELVAAFEDCMQQLQDEEESILRQMDGHDLQPDEDQIEDPSSMKIDM